MAPMAVPTNGINGVPLGVPMSNHEYDMTDADSFNKKGFYSVGANPPPAWSQREKIKIETLQKIFFSLKFKFSTKFEIEIWYLQKILWYCCGVVIILSI